MVGEQDISSAADLGRSRTVAIDINIRDAKRVLQTALICAREPLTMAELQLLFADALDADMLRGLLGELSGEWADEGVELVAVATG